MDSKTKFLNLQVGEPRCRTESMTVCEDLHEIKCSLKAETECRFLLQQDARRGIRQTIIKRVLVYSIIVTHWPRPYYELNVPQDRRLPTGAGSRQFD